MPSSRHQLVLDAAIGLLGNLGVRAVTHRAVDGAAGLPAGSTSNCFRTRDALFDGIVARFSERERANWDRLAGAVAPRTPGEMAGALSLIAVDATGQNRTLTLARYSILVEAARRPELRGQLMATGARVNAYFSGWLRDAGSVDPDRDLHLIANYWTGLVLHELAIPDPAFDPEPRLAELLGSLIPARISEEFRGDHRFRHG